jgi:hypothetical protein
VLFFLLSALVTCTYALFLVHIQGRILD